MEAKPAIRLKVPFGLLQGRLVAPSEPLASGLKCDCICPGCSARLQLKQGKKRRHFAHHNAPASERCVERSIHSAAIQVLVEQKYLRLPEMKVEVSAYALSGAKVRRTQILREEAIARFDECRPEVTFVREDFGTIRADVVGYKGGRQLLVEMWFTHAVHREKKSKLERLGLPAVEIYLGDLDLEDGFEAIQKRVSGHMPAKEWLFYPGADEVRKALQEEVDAEVARLNETYVKAREEERRRTEQRDATRRAEAQVREAERQAKAREIEEQNRLQREEAVRRIRQYQELSLGEKLLDVRRKLSMTGIWPPHLRLESPDNEAVHAPHSLWQAAVFLNFVFHAPLRETGFAPHQVFEWVRRWFGETPGTQLGLQDAVVAFLVNLETLGFIAWARCHAGGFVYSVVHNELAPPSPSEKLSRPRISGLTADEFAAVGHMNSEVKWNPNWPDYDTVKNSITRWISMSQKDELHLLDALFVHRSLLPTPIEFAMEMRRRMPTTVIFNFLRNHCFVL